MIETGMLVAGGGAVGMALALSAKEDAVLLSAPPHSGGRYYALGGDAVRFLATAAGSSPPVCTTVREFHLYAGGQRHILTARDEPLCVITDEDELLSWLGAAAVRAGVAQHEWSPMAFAGCETTSRGICVRLPDGREFSAGLLAAADGARSPAAAALRVGAAASAFGQVALTMMLETDGLPDNTAAQWFETRDILALLPVSSSRFALVWSMPEARGRALTAEGAAAVSAAVSARVKFPVSALGDEVRCFPLFAVRRAMPVAPCTAFVGDAAQTVHPLAGQGLNIGLANAELLQKCRRRHANVQTVLRVYAARSCRRTAAWHAATCFFNVAGAKMQPLLAAASTSPLSGALMRLANGQMPFGSQTK